MPYNKKIETPWLKEEWDLEKFDSIYESERVNCGRHSIASTFKYVMSEADIDELDNDVLLKLSDSYGLNDSESLALEWLVFNVGIDLSKLSRPSRGVDFIYDGNYGLEIKRSRGYKISRAQLFDIRGLEFVYIIVSNEDGVGIYDCLSNLEIDYPPDRIREINGEADDGIFNIDEL